VTPNQAQRAIAFDARLVEIPNLKVLIKIIEIILEMPGFLLILFYYELSRAQAAVAKPTKQPV